jgi:hypothetical protein
MSKLADVEAVGLITTAPHATCHCAGRCVSCVSYVESLSACVDRWARIHQATPLELLGATQRQQVRCGGGGWGGRHSWPGPTVTPPDVYTGAGEGHGLDHTQN